MLGKEKTGTMQNDGLVIRLAEIGDIEAIEQIALSNCKNPWNLIQFEEELEYAFSYLYCAELNFEIVGFVNMHIAAEDAHINEIAVDGIYRRRGIGDRLMHRCIEEAMSQGCEEISLEVREKNRAALGLYLSMGFQVIGTRPRFYRNPEDNAVILKMNLKEDELL